MKIGVIAEIALGSHRAHAINVVKTAGGMLRLGHEVVLLCRAPEQHALTIVDALSSYGEEHLQVVVEPQGDAPFDAAKFGLWAASAAMKLGVDCVYARHFHGAIQAAAAAIPTIMETHAHVGDQRAEVVKALRSTQSSRRGIQSIITIGDPLKRYFESLGAVAERVHIVPDGVDVELFAPPVGGSPVPEELAFIGRPRVTYAGHLYDYKGVPTIIEAAAIAPELSFVLLGGTAEDVDRTRNAVRRLNNVCVLGAVEHVKVPPYLWHSDVLLLPPSSHDPSAAWTSPVKLGEYLASGIPIVASSIRALKRWVTNEHVQWFEPDSARSMLDAIFAALSERADRRMDRLRACSKLARSYSYPNRAARILATLGECEAPCAFPFESAA